MGLWGAGQQLMAFPGNPMLDLVPNMVEFLNHCGPLISETLAASSEGDLAWTTPAEMPAHGILQRELESIRSVLAASIRAMRTWRLSLDGPSGLSFDRRLFAFLC